MPSLTALRAFEAAARNESFKSAAEELCVSQSAISHQIKDLETALGVNLFERQVRAVKLTAAGAEYFLQLKEAFDKIQAATRRLAENSAETVLTIQTYSTLAIRWFIPLLDGFNKEHPDIDVRVVTDQNEADFFTRSIDAAIMIGLPRTDNLTYTYLFTPTFFPVCAPQLKRDKALKDPRDLAGVDLLQVYPSENDWRHWLDLHQIGRHDISMIMNLDSYDHALKLCTRGAGVALGMQPYVADDLADGSLEVLFPDKEVASPGSWYFIYPGERGQTEHLKTFESWLVNQVEQNESLMTLRKKANT